MMYALGGTGFTFFMTALGAAVVFFFRGEIKEGFQKVFLGFAAGVMIAASVWSLLIPAIDQAESMGLVGWMPAAGGFLIGGLFLFLMDQILPHIHARTGVQEGIPARLKRTTMLVFAVTLHNAPEGMSVGLAFALAVQEGIDQGALAAAVALAVGIGIQNFPEGAAISLPLRQEGLSRKKAFAMGAMSGAVEPVAGVAAALLAAEVQRALPWMLAFAAGAMIYVVAEELIPEASLNEHSHLGTWGVMVGFLLMMILDVALG
jgi:ZIP family zinc transporter